MKTLNDAKKKLRVLKSVEMNKIRGGVWIKVFENGKWVFYWV